MLCIGYGDSGETGEGSLSAHSDIAVWIDTPHPALRATFSHKGRRKKSSHRVSRTR